MTGEKFLFKSGCETGYVKDNSGRCKKVNNITISGRRWFDRINGNTYHSVDVYANGQHIGRNPYEYGYGDQYIQTAHEMLQESGICKKTGERLKSGIGKDYYEFMQDMRTNRSKYVIIVSDVPRKKDL
jgi:hypothetical protein